ncbi:unnamed protein product [Trifolium pratense]|uniref:Uncharacterized protein n=1 Tax=Trifolium pratense TaxID=57577 RepID=A0ACB0KLQ0_TRIPR|nr:unnamed protein product [Trifolium pratense]
MVRSLYHFGSKIVKTIPVQLTDEEKGFYLIAEHRVKEKLRDMKLSNQPLEEERVKKQRLLDLELCILRLREMLSSIPLALKKAIYKEILNSWRR